VTVRQLLQVARKTDTGISRKRGWVGRAPALDAATARATTRTEASQSVRAVYCGYVDMQFSRTALPLDGNLSRAVEVDVDPKGITAADKRIAARIRHRRQELGVTQDSLAAVLGLSFQQVQKYEKGANRIGAARLAEIARALNVSVSYFFDDAGSEEQTYDIDASAAELLTHFAKIREPTLQKALIDVARTFAANEPANSRARPLHRRRR
jgi:transcriptional regulator with XRE-family HTH domain